MDALPPLQQAVQARLQLAEQLKQSGYPGWWKLREAVIYGVGALFNGWSKTLQDHLMMDEEVDTNNLPFDLRGFITNILLPDCAPQSE